MRKQFRDKVKLIEDASIYIACLWSSRTLYNHDIIENYATICKLKLTVSTMTEKCGSTRAAMFQLLVKSYFVL